jgi:hypothetical protein
MNQLSLSRQPDSSLKQSAPMPPNAYFNNGVNNATTRHAEHTPLAQNQARIKAKFKPSYIKLSEQNDTKRRLCALIHEAGDYVLANRMRDCSRMFSVLTSGHCAPKSETFHCSSRHCPFCAAIRAQERNANYLPKVEAFYTQNASVTPVHLVLTQKHRKGEQLLDSINRLLKSFRKLIRRAFWKKHCAEGGVYAVEFTVGRDGSWHAHLHCLVFRRQFFHVSKLRAEWFDVTKDSINFKIIQIDTLAGGLEEIIGYISKPKDVSKFTVDHVQQMLDIKGVRMFAAFGEFRTFCASLELPETEAEQEQKMLCEGDLCACHNLPLFRVCLDIKGRIELEKQIYLSRRIEKRRSSSELVL